MANNDSINRMRRSENNGSFHDASEIRSKISYVKQTDDDNKKSPHYSEWLSLE